MTWKFIQLLPGEHRLFQEEETGRLAFADQSGDTPDKTDDGTLFLDFKRHAQTNTGYVDVPVVDNKGNPSEITILWEDAEILQARYNLRIKTDEGFVRAKDILKKLEYD
jgi:hypothetical protein